MHKYKFLSISHSSLYTKKYEELISYARNARADKIFILYLVRGREATEGVHTSTRRAEQQAEVENRQVLNR